MPSVIALDAMGSDRAPKPEIEGAIHAARHYGVHVVLVGREPLIRAELGRIPAAASLPIQVIHASEVIAMEDKAVQAVRAKRDSSLRVGLRLVRERKAAGFVTAGNTGAAMATAKMVLGGLPGVDRPALAAVIPTAVGITAASAGRSTPGNPPSTILAVAIAAPVLPAVTNPAALRSRTSRSPTRSDESRLARTAWTALSSIAITSLAWITWIGREAAAGTRPNSARINGSRPTSTT